MIIINDLAQQFYKVLHYVLSHILIFHNIQMLRWMHKNDKLGRGKSVKI